MLSWESGCNLVVSIASFIICVISKQRSFSVSEGQFTDTTSQGRTVSSEKTSGSFGAVTDPELPSDDSVIIILVMCSSVLDLMHF